MSQKQKAKVTQTKKSANVKTKNQNHATYFVYMEGTIYYSFVPPK
jgi:hypothetical protein